MSSFDFGQQIRTGTLIPAQAWDGGANLTTSDALALNVANDQGVAVAVAFGAITAGVDIEIAFHEGDSADFTVAEGNKVPENYIVNSPAMDDTANASYVHSLKVNKPYLKVVVSRADTVAAALAVTGIVGNLSNSPA